jgi:molybdopterin biosynthesis enzyme MoaB
MESQNSLEPLPMSNQEEQEESFAEAQEMIKVKGFEKEVIQQEQRSIEEKLTMFITTNNNDLVLLTKNQNTLEALPMTNQDM